MIVWIINESWTGQCAAWKRRCWWPVACLLSQLLWPSSRRWLLFEDDELLIVIGWRGWELDGNGPTMCRIQSLFYRLLGLRPLPAELSTDAIWQTGSDGVGRITKMPETEELEYVWSVVPKYVPSWPLMMQVMMLNFNFIQIGNKQNASIRLAGKGVQINHDWSSTSREREHETSEGF